jgi:hypothetical protein
MSHVLFNGGFMTDNTASDRQDPNDHPPTHKNFRWFEGDDNAFATGAFLETTLDIAAGINTCLEIVYASDLERAANVDANDGETSAPAVGINEADKLMRMAIASSALLRDDARRRVESFAEEAVGD